MVDHVTTCPDCLGSGKNYDAWNKCEACFGFGDLTDDMYIAYLESKCERLRRDIDADVETQAALAKAWARIGWLESRLRMVRNIIDDEGI